MKLKNNNIRRIAVFTSGGDAPGMNAAIRSVVRTASYHDLHVFGVYRGYEGMIDGHIERLDKGDVGNIIQRGGTVLKTARSDRFRTPEGRKSAYDSLVANDIEGLVAIGGNGTFTGAKIFFEEYGIPIVGIPGTIDNDLYGTDYSIGFDTAVNTAIEAVDRIRDTADSHNRLFFVEVMGRDTGFIALNTGIGSGAGAILIPEAMTSVETLIRHLEKTAKRQKLFSLIIVAEGNGSGNAQKLAGEIKDRFPDYDPKVTIIGHMQRGGAPSALDRLIASRMGFKAVEALLEGHTNVMIGIQNNKMAMVSFDDAINKHKDIDLDLLRMAEILSL
ncbi:MAG: 6-phosphofructokinase [Saprospiraceae bacterium]|uniref:ATP-dependent 6-phosphofructokinase n=1 Tax=Candidatus Opimibacter skivensis TaxID=2982028 RepID=A0A9D7XS74_9BACT|nr:6-phosphofructokinase [Candidatus Opimibacter skivensis]